MKRSWVYRAVMVIMTGAAMAGCGGWGGFGSLPDFSEKPPVWNTSTEKLQGDWVGSWAPQNAQDLTIRADRTFTYSDINWGTATGSILPDGSLKDIELKPVCSGFLTPTAGLMHVDTANLVITLQGSFTTPDGERKFTLYRKSTSSKATAQNNPAARDAPCAGRLPSS